MADGAAEFTCLRCGKCCRELLAEDKGILRGLTLLPGETRLFPTGNVKPAIGVGQSPLTGGFKLIACQLEVDECPNLSGGLCSIYTERPASCRQFPFSLELGWGGPVVSLDMNCPAVPALLEGSGRLKLDELEAAEAFYRVKVQVAENPLRSWFYDLRSGNWVR